MKDHILKILSAIANQGPIQDITWDETSVEFYTVEHSFRGGYHDYTERKTWDIPMEYFTNKNKDINQWIKEEIDREKLESIKKREKKEREVRKNLEQEERNTYEALKKKYK